MISTFGISALMRAVASMPSSCGMRMSMRITSGFSSRANAIASLPFEASPITMNSGSSVRYLRNPSRTTQWSSTTKTLMATVEVASFMGDYAERLVGIPTRRGSGAYAVMVFQLQGEAVAAVINAARSRSQARALLDLAGILERALDDCVELTGSNLGYVDLLSGDGHRELAAVKGADANGAFVKPLSGLAVHANLANTVILKRQTKISNDVADDRDSVGVPNGHPPVRRVMRAPLVAGDAVLGMVVVANKRGEYTPADASSFS